MMLEWKNVTDDLPERSHQLRGRTLELCEVAQDGIELGQFSCPDGMWGLYVIYGKLYGTLYAPADKVKEYCSAMKPDIEAEYEKNGKEPSPDFIRDFAAKYHLTLMNGVY